MVSMKIGEMLQKMFEKVRTFFEFLKVWYVERDNAENVVLVIILAKFRFG